MIFAEIPKAVFFLLFYGYSSFKPWCSMWLVYSPMNLPLTKTNHPCIGKCIQSSHGSYMKRSRFTHGISCRFYSDLENSQVATLISINFFPMVFQGATSGLSIEDGSFGGIWRIFTSAPFQGGVELEGCVDWRGIYGMCQLRWLKFCKISTDPLVSCMVWWVATKFFFDFLPNLKHIYIYIYLYIQYKY